VIEEKIAEPTIEALVAAKSRAAERFSREIAAAMRRLAR
jgi:phosphoribosyl-ATP pyrophosphohydrolase